MTGPRSAHREIGKQLVSFEDVAKGAYLRVKQQAAAVTAEAVCSIGVMEPGAQAQQRRVQHSNREQPHQRRVDRLAAWNEPGALNEIPAGVQFADEQRNGIHTVFVVAVDSDHSLIAL